MSKIVVSDTTAIIHLSKIGSLNILQKLYSQRLIPDAVLPELTRIKKTRPGALVRSREVNKRRRTSLGFIAIK